MSTTTINASTTQTASVTRGTASADTAAACTGPINLTNGLAPGRLDCQVTQAGAGATFMIEYTKDGTNWLPAPIHTSPRSLFYAGSVSLDLSLTMPSKEPLPPFRQNILVDGEIGLLAAAGATAIRGRCVDCSALALTFSYYMIT